MPSPRYVPRSFAVDPAEFGRAEAVEWRACAPGADAARSGSILQHRIAWQVRRAIRLGSGKTIKGFAYAQQLNYERLTAMLRGEIVMHLDDAAELCDLLELAIGVGRPSPVA